LDIRLGGFSVLTDLLEELSGSVVLPGEEEILDSKLPTSHSKSKIGAN
jgi:hypothetical protein